MSKISLRQEFKKIVHKLPELSAVQNIVDLETDIKSSLIKYFKYYNLPGYSDSSISCVVGKFNAFDFKVVAQIYQSIDKPISQHKGCVVFVHGYLDHIGLYANLINYLVSNGYIFIGLDLPGHGLSTGKLGHIVDFGQYAHTIEVLVDILKIKFGDSDLQYYLSGFSAGAAIGTEYLLRNNQNIFFSKALWLAPLLRIPFWKYTELACWLLPFIKYVPRESRNISHDSKFVTFITYNDPMQPRFVPLQWINAMHHWVKRLPKHEPLDIKTCIVQGTEDKTIDWRRNIPDLARIYPEHQVHYVPDGYHNLCNESEIFQNRASKFLLSFLNN